MTVSGLTMSRAERQSCQNLANVPQKQPILKSQGSPFSVPVENGQLSAKDQDFRHQFQARRKK
jgi:hypothetical protein